MIDFNEMSLTELKEYVKERGIRGTSAMKKQELVQFLMKQAGTEEKPVSKKGEKRDIPESTAAKGQSEVKKVEAKEDDKAIEEKKEEAGTQSVKTEMVSERTAPYGSRMQPGQVKRPIGGTAPRRAYQEAERKPYNNQYRQTNTQAGSQNIPDTEMRGEGNSLQNFSDNNNMKQEMHARPDGYQSPRIDYSDYSRLVMQPGAAMPPDIEQMDSKETKEGILEIMSDGYGFIRCDNFLPGEHDVYVAPIQIRKMNLKTGDIIVGNTRIKNQNEKFSALLYIKSINGFPPMESLKRPKFEDLTPIFPNNRIRLETPGCGPAMRIVDLVSPIGKGQRGMIVSQPKAGKTTLLKQIATAITKNHPDMHMIILLIDERPEEVTDIKESIEGKNVEVIYSTFDELPENHKRVSEMVIERAKRLVEHKKDVVILLDSITRLARAYNLTVQASGRTLSGGLDPAALHMPKKFFGAARNMREGGSLTILATALVDTGSRMDDVVFEEFKGTGNMELVLDRNLSEKRIFPAIDLPKSSTRRDDLLLEQPEAEANYLMRKAFNGMKSDDAVEKIIQMFVQTKTNREFAELIKKTKINY